MNYKIIILLSASFLALLLYSCQVYDNINNPQENGIIESETKWNLDKYNNSKVSKVYYKLFDKAGNLINTIEYNEQGNTVAEANYHINGSEVSVVTNYYGESGAVDSVSKSVYHNDNNGNVLSQINMTSMGDTVSICNYTYNDRGNLVEKREYSHDGKLISYINYSYSYDNQDNLSVRYTNPTDDGSFQSKDSLVYNNSNKTIDRVNINSSGEIDKIFTYVYNSSGKPIFETVTTKNGEIISKFSYEYKYYK